MFEGRKKYFENELDSKSDSKPDSKSDSITQKQMHLLWAKKAENGWLPLTTHLMDTMASAEYLWDCWLSEGVKRMLQRRMKSSEEDVKKLVKFLAAAHDIGKATPEFQSKLLLHGTRHSDVDEFIFDLFASNGIPIKEHTEFYSSLPHAIASELLFETYVEECYPDEEENRMPRMWFKNIGAILGSHHGSPPTDNSLFLNAPKKNQNSYHMEENGRSTWTVLQREIITYAIEISKVQMYDILVPDMPSQMLLTGLLIMADWIASNEKLFPYLPLYETITPDQETKRIDAALSQGKIDFLQTGWIPDEVSKQIDFFIKRFPFSPNIMQQAVCDAVEEMEVPGICIIEAQMGGGKTEAALAAAEIMARKFGKNGVFFALPTQATSNSMFDRLMEWVQSLDSGNHSIELMHGKAQFNDAFQNLPFFADGEQIYDEEDSGKSTPNQPIVCEWFNGRKTSMLADFAVGTIDQILFAALKQKHLMLRHLGLANKVVIVDEVHAYDAYMNVYLERALRWLGSYEVPVILLSATLPSGKKQELLQAYQNKRKNTVMPENLVFNLLTNRYPLVSIAKQDEIKEISVATVSHQQKVILKYIEEEKIIEHLQEQLKFGGCAGILVNTVNDAQRLAEYLRNVFGNDGVMTLHSRFLTTDRLNIEKDLQRKIGKPVDNPNRPKKLIVVGTQVLEQSLDIDFDVLYTQMCPVDLLFQRIGRLFRHKDRMRPQNLKQATCYLLIPPADQAAEGGLWSKGTEFIYGRYLLLKTSFAVADTLHLPDDIAPLVEQVYADSGSLPDEKMNDLMAAKIEWEQQISDKKSRAKEFLLCPPRNNPHENIVGCLDRKVNTSEARSQAAVRDTEESLEVILVRKTEKGFFRICGEPVLDPQTDIKLAKRIAQDTICLPHIFSEEYSIDGVITQLEEMDKPIRSWFRSVWLKGSLILILDRENQAELKIGKDNYMLQYDSSLGLLYKKK